MILSFRSRPRRTFAPARANDNPFPPGRGENSTGSGGVAAAAARVGAPCAHQAEFEVGELEAARSIVRAHPFATIVAADLCATRMPCERARVLAGLDAPGPCANAPLAAAMRAFRPAGR